MKRSHTLLLLLLLLIAPFTQAQYIKSTPIPDIGRQLELIRFSTEGNFVAGVVKGDVIKVWIANTVTFKPDIETGHRTIHDLEFTADSKHIISVGKDGRVVMWEVETGQKVKEFYGHKDEVYSLDISFDGELMATASEDRMVKLWDLTTGQNINTFFTHLSPVLDVAISDDGKILASIGEDNKLYARELPWGKELKNGVIPFAETPQKIIFGTNNHILYTAYGKGNIQVIDLDKNDLNTTILGAGQGHKDVIVDFSVSPDGKFLASADEDERFIIWDLNRKIKQDENEVSGSLTSIDFDPKGKALYTTGKSENIWDVSHMNIIPRTNYRNSLDNTPPTILLTSPRMRGEVKTITGSSITIEGKVFDDSGLHSLTVNGNKVDLSSDGSFSVQIQLSFGANSIKIRAKDINNLQGVKEFTVVRESQSETELILDVVKSNNYLLIIGADKYEMWPSLGNAVSDAKAVKQVLFEKYGFTDDYTIVLYDEQVTRKGIYDAFSKLNKQVGPNDNLLIYYSGHGAFDENYNEGYWVPVDAKKGEFSDYFSNQELLKRISTIKSKHTFLVVDACYSGSLFLESTRGGGYLDKVGSIKSRWGLASGRLEEVADGAVGGMSPFCKRFIEYLESNTAERFAVSELVQYVKRKVADDTNQVPNGNPLQGVGDEGGEFIFSLEGASKEGEGN